MSENKKDYEISYLALNENGGPLSLNLISQHGGEIKAVPAPLFKKINFAYRIKKLKEGYFGCLEFSASPDSVALIKHDLGLSDLILRSLIITVDKKNKAERDKRRQEFGRNKPSPSPQSEINISSTPPSVSEIKPGSLSNEDLTKKLEEILTWFKIGLC